MQALPALNTIIAHSGKPKTTIAADIGRSLNYIHSTTIRGSVPKADNYAKILDACGYDLVARRRDGTEEIIIEPPKDES